MGVEVDIEEEDVVHVIVDELSMAAPFAAVDGYGVGAGSQRLATAQGIAPLAFGRARDYGAPLESVAK